MNHRARALHQNHNTPATQGHQRKGGDWGDARVQPGGGGGRKENSSIECLWICGSAMQLTSAEAASAAARAAEQTSEPAWVDKCPGPGFFDPGRGAIVASG